MVFFLYPTEGDALVGTKYGGTGFLVAVCHRVGGQMNISTFMESQTGTLRCKMEPLSFGSIVAPKTPQIHLFSSRMNGYLELARFV